MRKENDSSKYFSQTVWIAVSLILYLFYYSYRYIFRYNDVNTSPTYLATPFFFQLLKFVLLAIIIFCMLLSILHKKMYPQKPYLFLAIVIFIVQEIYAFLLCGATKNITALMCFLPAFFVLLDSQKIRINWLDTIFLIFLYFTILYELIQIVLFVAIGRLPALGYPDGGITNVRFGGPWDDPNGFSIMLSFLIPYAYCKFRKFKRWIIVITLCVFLVLTWSMTGIACFVGVCLLCLGYKAVHWNGYNAKSLMVILSVILLTIACIGVLYYANLDKINEFLSDKSGSFQGHLDSWNISGISLATILGLLPVGNHSETCVVALLYSGGILHVVIFYLIGGASVLYFIKLIRYNKKNTKEYSLYIGMICYQIAFMIASFNLPVVYLFSNIGIFCIFLIIAAKGCISLSGDYQHLGTTTVQICRGN